MNTRLWQTIGTLIVVALIVAACGGATAPADTGEQADTGTAAESAAPEETEKVSIVYWTHDNEPRNQLDEQLITEFMAENPDIEVKYEVFPFEDYDTKLLTAMAGQTGPDLFNIFNSRMVTLAASDAVAPVDASALGYASLDEFKDLYVPGALDSFTFGDTLYAIPTEINNQALFINVEHFKEAGLDPEQDYPKTWEELVKVSQKLTQTDAGGEVTRRGYDFTYGGDIDLPVLAFEGMAYQLGGTFFNQDMTEATINSEANVKALQFWSDWIHTYELGDPSVEEPIELFGEGDLYMVAVGTWFGPWLEEEFPETAKQYAVVPFPRFEGAVNDTGAFLYAYGHMVNNQSTPTEQAAAWKLASYLESRPSSYFKQAGLIQPRTALETEGGLDEVPYADVFWNDMKGTPADAMDGEMWEVVMRAIQRVTQDDETPQASLDQAQKELNDILNRD
jgi:multiple sugar transport system substrate-binding protein